MPTVSARRAEPMPRLTVAMLAVYGVTRLNKLRYDCRDVKPRSSRIPESPDADGDDCASPCSAAGTVESSCGPIDAMV